MAQLSIPIHCLASPHAYCMRHSIYNSAAIWKYVVESISAMAPTVITFVHFNDLPHRLILGIEAASQTSLILGIGASSQCELNSSIHLMLIEWES